TERADALSECCLDPGHCGIVVPRRRSSATLNPPGQSARSAVLGQPAAAALQARSATTLVIDVGRHRHDEYHRPAKPFPCASINPRHPPAPGPPPDDAERPRPPRRDDSSAFAMRAARDGDALVLERLVLLLVFMPTRAAITRSFRHWRLTQGSFRYSAPLN